jgi:ornithine cyclodeaminase
MQPPVMQLQFPESQGETCIKSAFLGGRPVAAVKVASGFYKNTQRDPPLPSSSGLMLVMDATTGVPLAVLADGGFLTDLRTGAAGALAVELFTPKRTLKKVAIIGSGIQARCTRTHIHTYTHMHTERATI